MREAASEIIADLPDALLCAAGVAAFITMIATFAAIGAGA
jgi:hypothetical protein